MQPTDPLSGEMLALQLENIAHAIFWQNAPRARELDRVARDLRALKQPRLTRERVMASVSRYLISTKSQEKAVDDLMRDLEVKSDD